MENQPSLVKQVQFAGVASRVKMLGYAIMFGLTAIYLVGMFVSGSNINKDLALLNLISLIICSMFCISSVYVKKMMLKKVNSQNFRNAYFTAHIVAFALCDAGGLFA